LYQNEKLVDKSSRPVSILKDQLATNFGLLISIDNRNSPGDFLFKNQQNGFQAGRILFANKTKAWFAPIPASLDVTDTSAVNWWANSNLFSPDKVVSPGTLDINGSLRGILTGSFAPYSFLRAYEITAEKNWNSKNTGASILPNSTDWPSHARYSLSQIQNVDLVITSDKSKWTRCIVFQGDTVDPVTKAPVGTFAMTKSRVPSVDQNYKPTGELNSAGQLSKGLSWFPGYAIDLDRGIRLNLAFSESSAYDTSNGNNLKWEPSKTRYSNKNYVYVFDSKYDSGRVAYPKLDSINRIPIKSTTLSFRNKAYGRFWAHCTWTGRVALLSDTGFLATQARVRLRVDKSYRSYPDSGGAGGIPTYAFSTTSLAPVIADKKTADSALSLIRVVPNPYYAYSTYEQSQVDNRVRITNLPTRYQMSIFNLSGSLIRQFNVDYSNQGGVNKTTYQDWDLKTQAGLPIASGIYLIYINAYGLGTKTVKWFGVMRPTDLDAISAN
jgi:hypothetical protein